MKRIRKFNESTTDLDYDYIYNCFAELIDDNKAAIFPFQNDHQRYISIYLKMKPFSSVEVGTPSFSNSPQTVRTTKVGKSDIFKFSLNSLKLCMFLLFIFVN